LQDDWDDHLPLVEFAVNSSKQVSIGTTPFLLNGGRQPLTPADLQLPSNVPAAASFEATLRERLAKARACLQAAQDRQKMFADRRRQVVAFEKGQEVLLNTKNITFKTPGVRKLMPRYIGPFRILKMVTPVAAKLQLPPEMRIHPVFHVSLMRHYKSDGKTPTQPAFNLGGDNYWAVETIVDHKDIPVGRGKHRREYFVKWQGFPASDNSWEPEANLCESAPVEKELESYEDKLPEAQRKGTRHATLLADFKSRRQAPASTSQPPPRKRDAPITQPRGSKRLRKH
jgi:hypothetical protein